MISLVLSSMLSVQVSAWWLKFFLKAASQLFSLFRVTQIWRPTSYPILYFCVDFKCELLAAAHKSKYHRYKLLLSRECAIFFYEVKQTNQRPKVFKCTVSDSGNKHTRHLGKHQQKWKKKYSFKVPAATLLFYQFVLFVLIVAFSPFLSLVK